VAEGVREMAFRRAQSDEEKAARAAQKEAERDARTREKAAAADQARLAKEAQQREQARRSFLASPAGQARAAFERGDHLFQFFMDVKDTTPVVVKMVGATTTTTTADPVAILNTVCNEGWELVNGSFVFHELGSESRDKFLASGQNVAVRGTIIGYYLFRRCVPNRAEARDAWEVPDVERACPHCGSRMYAAAGVCPQCHLGSEPWVFQDNTWWRTVDGEWHRLDDGGEWKRHSESGEMAEAGSGEA
jgi:hypothetical protein